MPSYVLVLCAAACGIAAGEIVSILHPGREPIDVPEYWQIGYPLMLAASAALGYKAPAYPVRIGFAVGMGQAIWYLAKSSVTSGVSNLWPLSLLVFAALSLPCVAAAWIAAWFARQRAR